MPREVGGGVWVWLGPDRPAKLQRLRAVERARGIQPLDQHRLDAAATTPAELLALCRQRPALSPLRLVVVEEAHRLDEACVSALLQHAEVVATVACVVLLVETELPARHPLSKFLRQAEGGRPGGAIAVERFSAPEEPATKPFALAAALGRGAVAEALAVVRERLGQGHEPLELLGSVAWQLTRWVRVKRLLEAGYRPERIAAVSGLSSWQVQRVQSEVQRRSLASLREALARCWQLDVDAKRGRAMPELAVEQLVVELCLPDSGSSRDRIRGPEAGAERGGA